MHEATRTFCCRTGFMLCCLLPTLVIGSWIGVRRSPVYAHIQQQRWQSLLSKTLGVAARVERVEEPRPGAYILYGVSLIDPDAAQQSAPLARSKRVELASGPAGLIVLASETQITSQNMPRLWAILHERLVRGPEITATPVHVSLASLTLVGPAMDSGQSITLTDVRLQLVANATAARGALEFRLADEAGEPARLSIERDRTQQPVATRWSLNSGAAPLPCSALAPCIPSLSQLGPDAVFHGYVTVDAHDQTWQAAVGGALRQIELRSWAGQRLGTSISGIAELDINQAAWRDGKIVVASGEIRARQGTISRRLWEKVVKQLSLEMTQSLLDFTDSQLRYDQLAIGFDLNEQSLRLAGQCVNQPPDTILADEYGPRVMGLTGAPRRANCAGAGARSGKRRTNAGSPGSAAVDVLASAPRLGAGAGRTPAGRTGVSPLGNIKGTGSEHSPPPFEIKWREFSC